MESSSTIGIIDKNTTILCKCVCANRVWFVPFPPIFLIIGSELAPHFPFCVCIWMKLLGTICWCFYWPFNFFLLLYKQNLHSEIECEHGAEDVLPLFASKRCEFDSHLRQKIFGEIFKKIFWIFNAYWNRFAYSLLMKMLSWPWFRESGGCIEAKIENF